MATKTLTITEEAYNLLTKEKMANESFSMEITRVMDRRKGSNLMKYFGILSDEEGEDMLKMLKMKKPSTLDSETIFTSEEGVLPKKEKDS